MTKIEWTRTALLKWIPSLGDVFQVQQRTTLNQPLHGDQIAFAQFDRALAQRR